MASKGAALILLCTFALVSIVSSQTCSSGWSLISGRCYRVFEADEPANMKTWYESQQACQSYGGDLVVIKSMDLQNELTLMLFGKIGSFWMGLQYDTDESDFYWIDSTPLNPDITRWSIDEPNNVGSGEDCVEMYGTSGLWNDTGCSSTGSYICERGTDVLKKCDEDNGWVSANGKCYKFYDTPQNWEGAKTYCRSVDGDLVDVNSADEQNVVTVTSQLSGKTFWIGLTNKYYTVNSYMWSTGEQLTYTNWGDNEPASRHFDDGGDCAEVLDTAKNGEWITAKCTDSRGFMCERNEGTCAPGWRIHKGNCYQFNSNTQVSYTDAKHVCEAQGTFLVSIFSGEDNDYIVSQFEDLVNIGITDIWIGISDYPTDGVFVWSDNSAVTYTNWKTDEPANTDTQHDCGMIYTGDTNGQWNTDNCFVLKAYVCKVRAGQPVYVVSPNLPVGVCPAGWNLFGDSCYYSGTNRLNWNSAESYCVNQNAHLVAVNDDDEQSYISMRVAGNGVDTWIGLHDSGNRDNYVWSDGSSLDIDNWADGNPNYPPSGEACVVVKAQDNMEGLWDDMACTTNKPYICEKAKACETLTTYSTDTNFYYRYHPSSLPTNRVEFEVKAASDVHVSLTSSNTGQGQMYEIVIGGWSNTQSVIRLCGECGHEVQVSTVGILSASEFRGFWINYESDGHISVGKYGEGVPFMEWTDPNPFQVNYIGYSTGYGSDGEFKFCNLDAGSTATGSIILTVSSQTCSSGWSLISGRCYRVFEADEPANMKTWYESQQACQSYGGDLVVIKSMDLQNELTLMLFGKIGSFWMGLQYDTDESDFYWIDSTPLNPDITRWSIDEPNNVGSGEDCVEMYGTSGLWNDARCSSTGSYICERGTDVLKKCDEDNGWVSASGKCYKFYDTPQNWEGAKTYCRNVDGDLVDVNSADEQNVVTATSQLSGKTFWIGLTNKYYTVNSYMWSTGEQLTYTNWGDNEPASRHFDDGGDCAEVLDTAKNGEWITAKCTDSRGFMCERNEGTCAPGWRIHKGNCYQFNSNTQVSYTDAKHVCEAQGTFLVSIFSGEDNDYIVSQFEDLVNIGITDIWIGIADYPTDGVFVWSDNSAVTYTNWKTDEPANTDTQHDCGMINTGDTNGQWNTDNCFVLKAYVCKVRAGQPVYVVSPNLPVGVCPAGWNLFGDSCYYSGTNRLNWNSAESYCVNQNAHLVAVNDDDEQSYISMRVAGNGVDTWIGLHDSGNRDNYVWSDGSSLDIDNWADGNPNYPPSEEACVVVKAQDNMEGLWDDMACTTNKPYICEKAKACETLTTYSTDTNFYYRYHPSPLPTNRVEFEVKAASDVHVSLTSSNTGQGQMYEIVIGGWSNTQSVIRLCGECGHEAQVPTVGILSGSEFRGFWINYESDGHISVGKYGEGVPFMEWTDPNPFQVNYIGYSTGYGFDGEFKFCNLDAGSTATGSIIPTAAFDPRCGSGWEFDSMTGNCYLFKPTSYKTWANAELECNKGGGNLVSIGGLGEMSYINSRMALITESLLWIGATDASREGGWMWSDNSGFKYLNWAPGEPNNAGEEGEHCVEMYVNSGMWNDVECNKGLGYICKKNGYLVDHFNVYHSMYIDGYDNLQLSDIFPEDCAKQCVQQTQFTCRSFEYNTKTMQCSLSDTSVIFSSAQLSYMENIDYYERPVGNQCVPGWDLFQSRCYYFDKYAVKNWYDARAECQDGQGDLALVKTADVNNYITTQIVSLDGAYWFGLHDLSDEGNFEWVDGTNLTDTGFTRWDIRQPDNYGEAGEDCVVMWTSGLWNDRVCTNNAGLICDQDAAFDVSYPEVTPTLPPVYRCPNGWHTFVDNCYLIQRNTGNWQAARDQCRSMGADLASIDSSSENDYLAALITQSGITGPLTHVWIGLNDLRVPLTFEWSDGSEVLFTYWNDNEPNNFLGADEDCVEMVGGGAWNDERCISINPSICEMSKQIIEGTAPPVTSNGCDLGWVAYGGSCYGLTGKVSNTWANAQSSCESLGGKLVSIKDRYEQTVVTSLLSSENGNPIWIGLNDLIVEGKYHWSDGSGVTYTHWDYQEPQENNGNCVAATSGLVAGLWQVKDCESRYDYLCEIVRDGFTAAPTVTLPRHSTPANDNNCADGWIGYGDKCFRVYDFGDLTRNMRTWQMALSQCRLIGGDLASFHSTEEETYIKDRTGNIENGFWIGLHDRSSETGFEWTDGSVVDYVAWGEDEPNNRGTIGEDCVELYFNGKGWNDKECTSLRSWICQIDKGKVPGNTPEPPPSLPPYTPCPTANDWVLEGDFCYFFSAGANLRFGWNDANAWCMENGGYLVSIHGSKEQDKLSYYSNTYSYNSHWIGIREYDIAGTYVWADDSALDYQNWREGEPNDVNGEEQCGEMKASDGFWNDLNCGDSHPFICKRVYHETIPKTYPPTPPPTGNCPTGWIKYGYRCYKIYGYTQSEKRSWYDARDNCQVQGGELVIIHSEEIQSFIVSKMKEVTFTLYIGLSDITDNGQFRWVDGTPVDFTNWDGREPNEVGGEEDCVEMLYRYGEAGRWNDIGCTSPKGYICQRSIDPSYPQQPPDVNNCETGYVQYYESCFKILTSSSDFATAGATCQNDGYYLASIHDQYEQAFVETLMYSNGGNPVWIGMRKDNNGEYTWIDGWPTYYTNWAFQEPSQGLNEGCIMISTEGTWDDTSCSSKNSAVCKYTSLIKPTNPPDTPGTCPSNWLAYGNDCFLVRASPLDLASFPEAQFICRGYGAELASVHSSLENKLIFDAIAITLTDVWLGMDRTLDGSYKWVDGTPVNYLNWSPNQPSYTDGDIDELCVEMYPGSGMWNDRECLQKQGFVCRASKYALNPTNPPGTRVTEPSRTTKPQVTQGPDGQTGMSSGAIAGMVIGILAAVCLAAVIIFFFITRKKSPPVAKTPGLPPSVGFDNALYSSGAKEGKVQIGITDPTSVDG